MPDRAQLPLDRVQDDVWSFLRLGVDDRRHPARAVTLASVGPDGGPRQRTMVARAWSPPTLQLQTDVRSLKWRQMTDCPRVSVHIYSPEDKLQVRLRGTARLHHSDDISAEAWSRCQRSSRRCYTRDPGSGQPLFTPDDWVEEPASSGESRFGVIAVTVDEVEWLYLRASAHRRALLRRVRERWDAQWVAP